MPVYIAKSPGGRLVKIGWSKHPEQRMRQIGYSEFEGEAPVLIRVIECPRWGESWFHQEFRVQRIGREWFSFCLEMLTADPPEHEPRKKRNGTAFWFSDEDTELLREMAFLEGVSFQQILLRALREYAEESPEYQASLMT